MQYEVESSIKNLFGLEFIYVQVWVLNIARKASYFVKTVLQITLQYLFFWNILPLSLPEQ